MPHEATDPEPAGRRIVITGGGRGLGLEFTSQYLLGSHRVFALVRRPDAPALVSLAMGSPAGERLTALACDVTDRDSVAGAARAIGQRVDGIDLLINNAGIAGATGSRIGALDYDDMRAVFEVDAIAPLAVTEQLLPLLRRGTDPRVVHVTSRMGSIADNESGGWWAYRMSKAALNMACKNMALELAPEGIATMVVHPGWVRTDMGGAGAPLAADESVRGMRAVIARLDRGRSGRFFDHEGTELPW